MSDDEKSSQILGELQALRAELDRAVDGYQPTREGTLAVARKYRALAVRIPAVIDSADHVTIHVFDTAIRAARERVLAVFGTSGWDEPEPSKAALPAPAIGFANASRGVPVRFRGTTECAIEWTEQEAAIDPSTMRCIRHGYPLYRDEDAEGPLYCCQAGESIMVGLPHATAQESPLTDEELAAILAEWGQYAMVPRLVAEVRRLRAMLADLEWAGGTYREEAACPVCHEVQGEKHAKDCALAAIIRK